MIFSNEEDLKMRLREFELYAQKEYLSCVDTYLFNNEGKVEKSPEFFQSRTSSTREIVLLTPNKSLFQDHRITHWSVSDYNPRFETKPLPTRKAIENLFEQRGILRYFEIEERNEKIIIKRRKT